MCETQSTNFQTILDFYQNCPKIKKIIEKNTAKKREDEKD